MIDTIMMQLKMATKEPAWISHITKNYNIDSFTIETCIEFLKENKDNDAVVILKSALD